MVRFLKFTLNINIYGEFVGFLSKLVWRETLFFGKHPLIHLLPTLYLSLKIGCSKIDTTIIKFTWGKLECLKCIMSNFMVKIMQPKESGGLGIRKVEDTNLTLLFLLTKKNK